MGSQNVVIIYIEFYSPNEIVYCCAKFSNDMLPSKNQLSKHQSASRLHRCKSTPLKVIFQTSQTRVHCQLLKFKYFETVLPAYVVMATFEAFSVRKDVVFSRMHEGHWYCKTISKRHANLKHEFTCLCQMNRFWLLCGIGGHSEGCAYFRAKGGE